MKKKLFGIAPVCLLAVVGMASCGGGGQSGGNEPKNLKEFIAQFTVGQEISRTDALKIFASPLIESNDASVTNASHIYNCYEPYWTLADGQDEEVYEKAVNKSAIKEEFHKYNGGIYTTAVDYERYGYDKSTVVDPDEDDGLAKEPVKYVGNAYIEADDEKIQYIYTQNEDANDPFSFVDEGDAEDERLEMLNEAGGLSGQLLQGIADVNEAFGYYSTNWTDLTSKETFTAEKLENGGFKIEYKGDLCMNLYSAERLWGWTYAKDDEDYENPLSQKTDRYNGIYVDRRISFRYYVEFDKDGFIANARTIYFSYWTNILRDTEYEPTDPIPNYPLTDEEVEALNKPGRLVVPEYLYETDESGNKKEVKNPYTGENYDDYLPYEEDIFATDGKDNGEFAGEAPEASAYRPQDGSDTGAWINAKELFEEIF